jgi:hypothetical protein
MFRFFLIYIYLRSMTTPTIIKTLSPTPTLIPTSVPTTVQTSGSTPTITTTSVWIFSS